MGLFDALFGGGFRKHKERGDRYRAEGQLGLAKAEYEAALRASAKEPEAAVEELRRLCTATRRDLALERRAEADRLFEDGFLDEAEDAYHVALELLEEGPERDSVQAALRRLDDAGEDADEGAEEMAAEGDEFLGETFEERFEILLMGLDDPAVAERYEALGRPFAEAVLLLHDGKASEAAAALQALLDGGLDDPLLRLELGRALLFAGGEGLERAVGYLAAWVDAHPEDLDASAALADALRQQGKVEEAGEVLAAAARVAPPESTALQHLAEHHLGAEQWDAAARAAQKGLLHRPRAVELRRVLGLALHRQGQTREGVKLLEGVLQERWRYDGETGELEFDRGTAWALARIYVAEGNREQRERAEGLLRALEQSAEPEERPRILLSMAEAQLALGRPDEGRRRLETVLALLQADNSLHARAGELLRSLDPS